VLRAGRVLDAGTPGELVARHANVATVRFTWPDPPAALLAEMSGLEGVRQVRRSAALVTVEGSRATIAHAGAVLVRYGPVPADLDVHVPSLDDAMLSLLGGPAETVPAEQGPAAQGTAAQGPVTGALTGGRR
jgi:ABC-2 type transport system ATP-binding protein